ncbi:MAG: hypothetical protein CW336_00165 [Bacteroidetes bacterium]|nr:hypothetical protein [Bacteroidota bacterium]
MNKIKRFMLLLGIILPVTFVFANSELSAEKDGVNPVVINKISNTGNDRSSSILASIDGHTLTIVFTENLGQVSIEVSYASGNEVETTSIYTPSGVIIYIPYSGSYIVTFTLPNGDEYYGEFEVTE